MSAAARDKPAAPAPAPAPASLELQREVEQFLFHEARLLDLHRFTQWLDLYTEDATYWIPLEANQADPFETTSIAYDDRTLLALRVRQYAQPRAHSRLPLARTTHQVGNVMLLQAEGEPPHTELLVGSTLVLVEYRQQRQRVWGANVEHRLRRGPGGLGIVAKRVDIVNSEADLDGIAFLF